MRPQPFTILLGFFGFALAMTLGCGRDGIPILNETADNQGTNSASVTDTDSSSNAAAAPKATTSSAQTTGGTAQTSAKSDSKTMPTSTSTASTASFHLSALPKTTAELALKYEFQMVTDYAKPDALSYAVVEGPKTMTISKTGLLSWVPTPEDLGVHNVTFKIIDPSGATLTYQYKLTLMGSCQTGIVFGVWRGTERSEASYLGEIVAYDGNISAQDNYDYSSSSVHLTVGPTPKDNYGTVFFYRDGQGDLSFFFFFSLDDGADSNSVKWDLKVTGNNRQDSVLVYDDPSDPFTRTSDAATNSTFYQTSFKYSRNSDGGVIGPFRGEAFQIAVTMKEMGILSSAKFYSQTGFAFPLYEGGGDGKNFIIGFKENRVCK